MCSEIFKKKSNPMTKLKYCYDYTIAGEVIDKSYWNCGDELLYTCQKFPLVSNYNLFPDRKRTTKNDLLLTRNATPYIFIPKENSIYSNVVQKITIKNGYDKRFIKYSLENGVYNITVNGDTIPSWNMGIWNNIEIPLMNIQKQTNIANYLDKKVSKIEETIINNKKSIELLEEYKINLISKIIKENEVNSNKRKLKYLGDLQNGISAGAEKFGTGDEIFINYGDVYNNFEIPEKPEGKISLTDKEKETYSLRKGDVLFTRTSETIEEVGMTSVCMKDYPNSAYSGFVIRFRPNKEKLLYEGYSKYYFKMREHRDYFAKEMNLVTRASLSQGLLNNLVVLLPDYNKQIEISKLLDRKFDLINKSIDYRKQIIEKLEEYKKSLIYEVVTGKIEV